MTTNFTQEEFKNAKADSLLSLICENCNNVFYKKKKSIKYFLIHNIKKYNIRFCSRECLGKNKNTSKEVNCKNCNINFTKFLNQTKSSPNHFCSRSCATIYRNTHKKTGTRKSKLENWLTEQLTIKYPKLKINYNHKDVINSELDIYIPELKLAFELNGIFHYEPIYGTEKLQQIQNNDNRKFQACLEKGIELVIIDTSSQKYFKEKTSIKFFNIIKKIINERCSAEGI